MAVRQSLRWTLDLPDPGDALTEDDRDERRKLAWLVFVLFIAGIATTAIAIFSALF